MPFAAILMGNTMLSQSSLALTSDALRYLGHAHLLYRWQWP